MGCKLTDKAVALPVVDLVAVADVVVAVEASPDSARRVLELSPSSPTSTRVSTLPRARSTSLLLAT